MNEEEPLPLRAWMKRGHALAGRYFGSSYPSASRTQSHCRLGTKAPSHSGIRPHKSYFALRTFSPQCNVASSSPSPLQDASGAWGRQRRRRPRGCGRRTRRVKRRFLLRADRLTDCKNGHKLLYGSAGSQPTVGREGGEEVVDYSDNLGGRRVRASPV